jgi:hypothetical protein
MASKRRKAEVSGWQQFANVSRAAVRAAERAAPRASKKRRGGRRAAPAEAPMTEQAKTLGQKQAQWVIAQRMAKQPERERAVDEARGRRAKRGRRAGPPPAPTPRIAARLARASRGLLVAEGDSWFDYPFYDVLKRLDDAFGWDVEQVAHRGDTVECMAYDGGQLDDFVRTIERVIRRGQVPTAILVSGGGNDVSGDGFALLLNHRSSPVSGLNPAVMAGVIDTRIRVAYTTILSAVTAVCESMLGARLPILLHGYDYPVPDGRGFLGGFGPLPGPWLEPGFREKGYDVLAERVQVIGGLIDTFYAMLAGVAATPGFSHVKVVDLRGTLSRQLAGDAYKHSWGNELHPTRSGFTEVARRFDSAL